MASSVHPLCVLSQADTGMAELFEIVCDSPEFSTKLSHLLVFNLGAKIKDDTLAPKVEYTDQRWHGLFPLLSQTSSHEHKVYLHTPTYYFRLR